MLIQWNTLLFACSYTRKMLWAKILNLKNPKTKNAENQVK